jgi:putative nucleotidyltransferase with HDIG domain
VREASPVAEDARAPVAPELTLSHLDSLPTLAPIAVRALRLASRPDTQLAELTSMIRADQALTGRLLSLANSAAYGVRSPVTTLERAVVLLGYRAVRNTVLAVKVFEAFSARQSDGERRVFKRAELWKHALGVACAAKRLAQREPRLGIDPEEAFVAGLLHDLGKVALDSVFPRAYERIFADAEAARGDIADSERAVLGIDHLVAGRYLAQRWSLPQHLQEVIWLHHLSAQGLPASAAAPGLIALVQLADTLVREMRLGASGNFAFYESATELGQQIGIRPETLAELPRELTGEVAELASVLGIDQQTPEALYYETLAKANAELARLNADLSREVRRLSSAARGFLALTHADAQAGATADVPTVIEGFAAAARELLKGEYVGAFAERPAGDVVDVAWCVGGKTQSRVEPQSEALRAWLQNPDVALDTLRLPAPPALRSLLAALADRFDRGRCWMLPIRVERRFVGGIVYAAQPAEDEAPLDDPAVLGAFLASLGQRLSLASAAASARRQAEELATAGRSMKQVAAGMLRVRLPAVIAEIAAGAGHELNGPLSVISGRAQMLGRTVTDPEVRRVLQLMQSKAHECSQIVSELMDFASPPAPQIAPVDVEALLTALCDQWLAQSGLPASQLRLVPPPPERPEAARPLFVAADREQLATVLTEVLRNAADALADGRGQITVSWRVVPQPAWVAGPLWRAPGTTAATPSEYVEISVRDNGPGMPPEVLARAFDPFFSHKRAGRRRGLGLPRAQRIVELQGGHIRLESQPGAGTQALVLMPRSAAPPTSAARRAPG